MSRRLAVAILSSCLAAPGLGQEPTPAPLVRSVEVSITNVDVVVRDRDGRHVTGLSRDEFVLKEDGVEQPLTNFFAIDEGRAAGDAEAGSGPALEPTMARVRLSVFVDNRNLTPQHRTQVLRAVGEFLENSVGGRVEASITTWDRKLAPRGPFTPDGKALRSIVARLEEEPAHGDHLLAQRDTVIRQLDQALRVPANDRTRDAMVRSAIGSVRSFALEKAATVEETLAALGAAVDQMAGIEGRKILIYVCEQIPRTAGGEMLQYLRDALVFQPAYQREIPLDSEFTRQERFRDVVRKAHAAGVAVYPFDARGLDVEESFSAERPGSDNRISSALEQLNNQTMLQYLADETGGSAVLSRGSFREALEGLERDFSSYYSLGYASRAPVGRSRKVVVTVKRPGLSVRSRTGHLEKSPGERVADAVVSNLWFPKTLNPLGARLDTGKPTKSGTDYILPFTFRLPFDRLTLLPEKDRFRGRLLFAVAALDESGRLSPVKTQIAPIDLSRQQKEDSVGKDFVFETSVEIRPVNQVVSFALTDEPSRLTSFAQLPLNIVGTKR